MTIQAATNYTIAALALSNLWETSREEPMCRLDTRNDLEFLAAVRWAYQAAAADTSYLSFGIVE